MPVEHGAFLGKRSRPRDAHDRNANIEVLYLLQRTEERGGVAVWATNRCGNIDDSFR